MYVCVFFSPLSFLFWTDVSQQRQKLNLLFSLRPFVLCLGSTKARWHVTLQNNVWTESASPLMSLFQCSALGKEDSGKAQSKGGRAGSQQTTWRRSRWDSMIRDWVRSLPLQQLCPWCWNTARLPCCFQQHGNKYKEGGADLCSWAWSPN